MEERWPTQSDYQAAMQNPGLTLRAGLVPAGGQVQTNPMGVPKNYAGALGIVYKYVAADGRATAVKVFREADPEREGRYLAVDAHLRGLGAARPAGLVGFRYEAEGIRVRSRWVPVQTMDWVVGRSLGRWFEETMGKGDRAAVRGLADRFARLVGELRKAKVAHGDLQHDNVMVVGDAPQLVDYDGMVVPAIEGRPQLEFGKPAYQHPGRGSLPLGLGLDSFSAWVILIALRAAAADPGVYDRYFVRTKNENLLFTPEDLTAPKESALWRELLAFQPDADVRRWANALRPALDRPADQVPRFDLDPHQALREYVRVRDWAPAAAEAERLVRTPDGVPSDLMPGVTEAKKRVQALAKLQAAPAADPRQVAAAAREAAPLLADWPAAAAALAQAKKAEAAVGWLDKLKKAAAAPGGDGRELVKLWDQARGELAGVREAEAYGREADGWRGQLATAAAFRKLIGATPPAGERAIADAWAAVVRAGRHPSLTAADQARGEAAARRVPLLARLAGVPAGPSEDADRQLVRAWDEAAAALAGCPEAEAYRPRVLPARGRLSLVEAVAAAVKAADAGGDAQAVVDAAGRLPAGYGYALAARVRQAADAIRFQGEQRQALVELQKLIVAVPRPDARLAAAWETMQRTYPKAAAKLGAADRAACDEAVRRRDVLAELRAIDRAEKADDRRDRRWAEVWKANQRLLDGVAEPDLVARAKLARDRLGWWAEVSRALGLGDATALRRLTQARPELAAYPPAAADWPRIDALIRRADAVEGVLAKLRSTAPDALSAADLGFIRENPALFTDDTRERVAAAVRGRLGGAGRLTAGQPPVQAGAGPGVARVRWGWGDRGLLSGCVLATDPARHLVDPADAGRYARRVIRPEDHQRDLGGATVPRPAAGKLYVTVWGMVELGWATVYGPPLHLGPVTPAAQPAAGRR